MPGFSLRRYDTQARVGLMISILSVLALIVLAVMEFQKMSNGWVIYYGPTRRMAILGSGLVTILLSVTGFGFGLSSAGQRRNDKPLLSWISFFIGGVVLCLAVVLLFLFYKQGELATPM